MADYYSECVDNLLTQDINAGEERARVKKMVKTSYSKNWRGDQKTPSKADMARRAKRMVKESRQNEIARAEIREKMTNYGISQADLGYVCGVSYSEMSRWFSNVQFPIKKKYINEALELIINEVERGTDE